MREFIRIWLLIFPLALGACANMTPTEKILLGAAYRDAGPLISCASQDYQFVDQALRQGKVSVGDQVFEWLGFAAANMQCIAPVVKDIYDAFTRPVVTSAAGPSSAAPARAVPSQATLRRAHAAYVLCTKSGLCK